MFGIDLKKHWHNALSKEYRMGHCKRNQQPAHKQQLECILYSWQYVVLPLVHLFMQYLSISESAVVP